MDSIDPLCFVGPTYLVVAAVVLVPAVVYSFYCNQAKYKETVITKSTLVDLKTSAG